MTRQGLLGAATIGRPLFVTPLYACLLVQEETLDCMFDLAFRKFRPADAPFQLDLLELFPTACANVLAEPSVARYPAQKRAAIAMCEMAGVHSVWLFSKAGGRAEERLLKVLSVEHFVWHASRVGLAIFFKKLKCVCVCFQICSAMVASVLQVLRFPR